MVARDGGCFFVLGGVWGGGLGQDRERRGDDGRGGEEGQIGKGKGEKKGRELRLEPLPPWPCFAAWELRSRSAWLARARGSWSWYSADMVVVVASWTYVWV